VVDSLLKWVYFFLAVVIFWVSSAVFARHRERAIGWFLYGGIAASAYGWYLFGTSLLGMSPVLLMGMEEAPQKISLGFGEVIRCGTFKEGNFMAMFLFVSSVVALYAKKRVMSLYFTLSLITTVSTIGMLSAGVFWALYGLHRAHTHQGLIRLIVMGYVAAAALVILLQNDDFKTMFISKLDFSDSTIVDQGAYSKEDRKNTILNALRMGEENPVFGVGLSNYALHYRYYNERYGEGFENYDFKVIANNVYAEIFAETGVVGLVLWGWFLYSLFVVARRDESGILRMGLWGSCFYFMAFPTFSVLFVWVYFGLIQSLAGGEHEADR
jgi:O-antigen ligase